MSHNIVLIIRNIVVLAVMAVAGVGGVILLGQGYGERYPAVMVGWGIAMGALIMIWKGLAGRTKRRMQGVGGEADVRMVLRGLGAGHAVMTDVIIGDGSKGDIDAIVIGPTGVWVLEIKSHKGKITAVDGKLARNGELLGKDVVRQVWGATYATRDAVRKVTGGTVPVRPVIVFSSKLAVIDIPSGMVDGAHVTGIDRIVGLIREARNEGLSLDDVRSIVAAIRAGKGERRARS